MAKGGTKRGGRTEWSIGGLVVVVFCLLYLYRAPIGFLDVLELKTYDLRMRLFGGELDEPAVAIVAIDQESIAKLGRWPWPRSRIAAAVQKLKGAGASVVGLDILFTEPEESSGLATLRALREQFTRLGLHKTAKGARFSKAMKRMAADLDNDSRLAGAVKAAGNVVLPFVFDMSGRIPAIKSAPPGFITRNSLPAGFIPRGDYPVEPLSASDLLPPVPAIGSGAAALGHLNRFPGRFQDGVDRWEPLFIEFQGRYYPSFALAVALAHLGMDTGSLRMGSGPEGEFIELGPAVLPVDSNLGMLVSYYDAEGAFPVYSFFDFYYNKINPDAFRGKVVLVGITDVGLGDAGPTPLAPLYSGVEREATVVENIIRARTVTRPWWAMAAGLAAIVVMGLVTTVVLSRLPAKGGAVAALLLLAAFVGAVFYAFALRGLWLELTHPALLVVVNYLAVTSRRFWFAEEAKQVAEVESGEANKLLGLTFQSKGMLEMAYEKFKRMPVDDEMKGILYTLALDFEKKRMWPQAYDVFEHIGDASYKDVAARMERLKHIITGPGARPEPRSAAGDTGLITEGMERPTLGRYELIEEVGRGAMGVVYRARDPVINRYMAIKTINFDGVEEQMIPQIKERFFREAQSAGTLQHPNILTIYDVGEDSGLAYIAMELIEGRELDKWIKGGKRLPVKEALAVAAKVADALDYAHSKGIVHRDIKPANIMVTKNGVIKVMDFGIAHVQSSTQTKTGVVLGTPSYMSPEQVEGRKLDGRSDIFSLGIVLYELLTGHRPFKGGNITSIMYNIAKSDPPPLRSYNQSLPECCQRLIDRALAKDRRRRFQTAGEMSSAALACIKSI
ncbi:MAG TPA: CHASE2 domain-containing protein [Deltaproteobacteria bacterium]|nr:CHASE2 domain-containing protein [Deltaproteobacteria bacterium]